MATCSNCHTTVPGTDRRYCPSCGAELSIETERSSTDPHPDQSATQSGSSANSEPNAKSSPTSRPTNNPAGADTHTGQHTPSSESRSDRPSHADTHDSQSTQSPRNSTSNRSDSHINANNQHPGAAESQQTSPATAEANSSGGSQEMVSDGAFCSSCGEPIKKEAEVCPECGVRQQTNSDSSGDLAEARKYELQKIARKDTSTAMIVSFLVTPLGYYMVGKVGLAIINLLTFNYLLLGPIIVPFHTRSIIHTARRRLEQNGESW